MQFVPDRISRTICVADDVGDGGTVSLKRNINLSQYSIQRAEMGYEPVHAGLGDVIHKLDAMRFPNKLSGRQSNAAIHTAQTSCKGVLFRFHKIGRAHV